MYDLKYSDEYITVEVDTKEQYGYFEIGDTEEDYIEGGLWFEENALVDFDGCYYLPSKIRNALIELGLEVNKDFLG